MPMHSLMSIIEKEPEHKLQLFGTSIPQLEIMVVSPTYYNYYN